MFALKSSIPNSDTYPLVIFDIRVPGVAKQLHYERAAWQRQSDIAALDQNHYVLIIRSGGAWGVAV
jgi:hypothetical protein